MQKKLPHFYHPITIIYLNQNKLVDNLMLCDGFHVIIPLEMVVADHYSYQSYAIKNYQRNRGRKNNSKKL